MNSLSLSWRDDLAAAHGCVDQPTLALLTAHTGVALVRIEGARVHRVLIDPSRAVLVRGGERSVVEASAPKAQNIGVLEFTPHLLETSGFPGRNLAQHLSLAPPPIEIPWSSRSTLALLLLLRGSGGELAEIDPHSPLAHASGALLHRVLARFDAPRAAGPRSRGRAAATHRRLAESAKMLIAAAPEQPHSLTDMARAVSASPFHLEHVFQKQAGISLHRYLLDFRLTLALNRLATENDLQLSRLALSLGFATHSHFTAAFHRAIGQTPTAVRRALFAAPMRAFSDGGVTRSPDVWLRILRARAGDGAVTIPWCAHTHPVGAGLER